jgi:HPr kinase/phosphorylase
VAARAGLPERPAPGRRERAGTAGGRVSPAASFLTVRELLGNPHLGVELFAGSQGLERPVRCPKIQRLTFTGKVSGKRGGERLASVSPAALGRLARLGRAAQRSVTRDLLGGSLAGLLVARDRPVPDALLVAAREQGLPILVTREALGKSLSRLEFFLKNRLGAEITVHGVLMEVFGVGVLLLGPSGIGKSESALELVTRGHRLIADDMVIVHRGDTRSLMGSGSGMARYHMEIRGVGIIDIKELFGVAAVLSSKEIELVIELEGWDTGKAYDRLGLDDHYYPILDTPLPHLRVPVSPGRNIAVILEVAARNHLLKRQGYHTARELNRRLMDRTHGVGE